MATFTSQIYEILNLNGDDVGSSVTNTINNVNYVDNRLLKVPSGSVTTLFSFDSVPGAGTFTTNSIRYIRVTNNSTTAPLKLIISSSTEAMSFLVQTGSSYMMSSAQMTGSTSGLSFSNAKSVKVEPSGSDANIEYYIVTA
jgi:hypothetical protein